MGRLTTLFTTLICTLFCFNTLILAQSADQQNYQVKLQSGTFTPSPNIESFMEAEIPEQDKFEGYYYRYLQFYQVPDRVTRQKLNQQGVKLLSYIPNNTYITAISSSFDRSQLSNYQVRSIASIKPYQKINPALYYPPFPQWAIADTGVLHIKVSIHDHVDLNTINAFWQEQQIQVLKIKKHTHRFILSVPSLSVWDIAEYPFVSYIEPIDPPGHPENYTGRTLHRSNAIATRYSTGRHYDGTGIKIGMQDDGTIGPHIDYQGRIGQDYTADNDGNHGDHVSGIIFGSGNKDPLGKGMAFGAELYVYDQYESSPAKYYEGVDSLWNHYFNPGVSIMSTSYSNGCNDGYTSFTQTHDQQVYQMKALMHVFSAGNDGTSNCGYGAGSDWGNITGGHKAGKNVTTVGNLDENGNLATSSSRGPAEDGRIKPDICAKGTNVYSTIDTNDYTSFTGTSMSCPGIAGIFAQMYQAYKSMNSGNRPPSGLIKAFLLNTADDLGNPGPDYKHGWGQVNALQALQSLENDWYLKDSIGTGNTNTHNINVPAGTKELRVMVYWTDYPANPAAATDLVNDLNLEVTSPTPTTYLPWTLNPYPDPDSLDKPAVRGVDTLNNMEQVTIDNPPNGNYTIDVIGDNVPMGAPQTYFVVYQLVDSSITVTYPIGGEGMNRFYGEKIRWNAAGNSGSFTIEYSTDSGSTWNTITSSVPGTQRYYDWTVPGTVTEDALIRVSRGSASDISDSTFSIIDQPSNLTISKSCIDSFRLEWSAVTGADFYEVMMLGNKYMEVIDSTTGTGYTFTGVNFNQSYWVTVRARTNDGARSKRAVAIQKTPGIWNCPQPYDLSSISIQSPAKGCGLTANEPITVKIKNVGNNAINSMSLNYQINNGAVVTESISQTINSGDTYVYTFSQKGDFSANMTYSLSCWPEHSNDNNYLNDTVTSSIQHYQEVSAFPVTENTENITLCGNSSFECVSNATCPTNSDWLNATANDDIDWSINEGATPSSFTGPDVDHTQGTSSGNYFFTEASGCYGNEAILTTRCFDLNQEGLELVFWYHMYGGDMGELYYEVDTGTGQWMTLGVISGQQQFSGSDAWEQVIISLPRINAYGQVRFRGVTGSGYQSDMAIDDINICAEADFTTSGSNLTVNFDPNMTGASSYSWDFGDGQTSNSTTPSHTYSSQGSYTVCLTIQSSCGTDSVCKVVNVPTGLEESPGLEDFVSVYPNPTDKNMQVAFEFPSSRDVKLKLTNMMGQQVYSRNLPDVRAHNITVPMQGMPAGVYWINLQTEQAHIVRKVIRLR